MVFLKQNGSRLVIINDTLADYAYVTGKATMMPDYGMGFEMLSMMIPGQLVLLPQYIMMAKVGLVNTLFAITLPYLSQSMFKLVPR